MIFLISSADTVDERVGSADAVAETGPISAPVFGVAVTFTSAGADGFMTAGFAGSDFVAGVDFAAATFFAAAFLATAFVATASFAAGLTFPWDCRRTTNAIALACSNMGPEPLSLATTTIADAAFFAAM